MRKWIVILLLFIICIAAYNYIYQDHRDINSEISEFTLSSSTIIDEFRANVLETESKYLNKTIEINGIATHIGDKNITLDQTVFCQFDTSFSSVKVNSEVTIKGRFIGYDELLEEVKLDQCTLIN